MSTVEVRLRLATLRVARGGIVAQLPMQVQNVDTAAEHIAAIEATDAQGTVQLVGRAAKAQESGDQGPLRVWIAPRALSGPLSLHYRVPANATRPPRGPAPPISFRNDDHAFLRCRACFWHCRRRSKAMR